ncbi:MAG TPA: hypothetical protein VMT54_01285 [Candidatus Cybelea sp.]|nr:hypothetical protein [Candidatus Cybelea sp.]
MIAPSRNLDAACNSAGPGAAEIRTYLSGLLGNKELNTSDRNRRFLSYIVEETLQGRADRIKAYSIALAALERGDDFDPLTDPIVRIEASRLRRALEHYYLTAGKVDRIRIGIPKGSYVPTFEFGADSSAQVDHGPATTDVNQRILRYSPTSWRMPPLRIVAIGAAVLVAVVIGSFAAWQSLGHSQPTGPQADMLPIIVLPFQNASGPERDSLAQAFTYELVLKLAQSDDVTVFNRAGGFAEIDSTSANTAYRYSLYGSVELSGKQLHVTAIMANPQTNRVMRAWNLDRDVPGGASADALAELAGKLVVAVKQVLAPEISPIESPAGGPLQ